SDELVVNFSDEAKGSGGKIEGVLALGGVCIEEAGKVIRGDRAEYFADENIILVTGGASAVECGDIVTADKIKLFLSTNNVVLMGGKGERVRASIRPTKDCDSEVAGEKFQCRRPR
ncbi:MAG: hypothetical protein KAR06_04050, partial [Deltaproteobacteria bacterium]|nr:hypothetical protein [Deltaproteobacteria bacterium]